MKINKQKKRLRYVDNINQPFDNKFNFEPVSLVNCEKKSSQVLHKGVNYNILNIIISFFVVAFMYGTFLNNVQAKSRFDIVEGEEWLYFKGEEGIPEKWQFVDFDDSDWFVGKSGIGYGNNPKNGSAVVNKDGSITYTPDPGFVGTDTFVYIVEDDNGSKSKAKVVVSVDPNNSNGIVTDLPNGVGNLSAKNNLLNSRNLDSAEKDKDKDKDKDIDFSNSGRVHVKDDDIEDFDEFPELDDDFVLSNGKSSVEVDVTANDRDIDGHIVPQSVALANNEEGELDDMKGSYQCVSARKFFEIEDPLKIEEMNLVVVCDGEFRAFINGIEVIRSSVPVNRVTDLSGIVHELFKGINVVAIECFNDDIDSDDFAFIPTLLFVEKGEK